MRLGAHISIAGGVHKAFQRADEATCDSMLVFTKSNRQWRAKPITASDVAAYHEAEAEYSHIGPVAVHASYLINVASPDPALWEKSYAALRDEVERADAFGIPLLTFHPGSYVSGDEQSGLANIVRALKRLLDETSGCATTVCLENMAGQGTNLGHSFEQLAALLDGAGPHTRLGICFDTCHAFAAGYDIRSPEAYGKTMDELDRLIGLDLVKCFHFNDSKFALGENKDRHEHIGDGHIGLAGFANFVNDARWAEHPAHLETKPTVKDEDGSEIDMNKVNLERLRSVLD